MPWAPFPDPNVHFNSLFLKPLRGTTMPQICRDLPAGIPAPSLQTFDGVGPGSPDARGINEVAMLREAERTAQSDMNMK